MLPRDVSRESVAEIFWTCRPQGHAVCLLSNGSCHCPSHQVMRASHVRKVARSNQTDPPGDVRIESGQVSEWLPHPLLSFLEVVRETILLLKDREKRETSKQFNYEKAREKKRERERARKSAKGLDISRQEDWTQWQKFVAGRPCRDEDLQKLLDEGLVVLPTRFLHVDRAAHL